MIYLTEKGRLANDIIRASNSRISFDELKPPDTDIDVCRDLIAAGWRKVQTDPALLGITDDPMTGAS
jgi:hypothetical protein